MGYPEHGQMEEKESGIYLSISDLMSGLLLIFVLLFIVVLFQLQQANNIAKENERIAIAARKELEEKIKEIQMKPRVIIGTLVSGLRKKKIDVQVNEETGDVTVKESLLFNRQSSAINSKGKDFLREFIRLYSDVIFSDPSFEKEISRIIIEGHASKDGDEYENMELSLMRALSVARFVSEKLDFPKKKLLAAGRGEADTNQLYDDENDRKVLFRIQFRGDEFIKMLSEMQNAEKTP